MATVLVSHASVQSPGLKAFNLANPCLARALFAGVKDVENRQRSSPPGWYAVYLNKNSANTSSFGLPPNFTDLMQAKGVAPWSEAEIRSRLGCIVGVVRLGPPKTTPSPWRMPEIGKFAFSVEEAIELLTPLPVMPMMGLWQLPDAVTKALTAAILEQAVKQALGEKYLYSLMHTKSIAYIYSASGYMEGLLSLSVSHP